MGTADGVFAGSTEEAVREFQIHAALPQAARDPAGTSGGSPDAHVAVPIPPSERYPGAADGIVDADTAAALSHWTEQGWRCPVVARAVQGTTVVNDEVWRHDDVTDPALEVRIRDLSGAWTLPAGRAATAFHPAGRFNGASNNGPVALAPAHTWSQAELLPVVAGAGLTPTSMDAGQRSTFKVLRAVSERECMGYLDSVATSDNAVLEAGLVHWTFGLPTGPAGSPKAPGELAAFAAFLEFFDLATFDAIFRRFGVVPAGQWRQAGGQPTGLALLTRRRTYVGWWSRPHERLLEIDPDIDTTDWFRGWHWVHRLQMAARTMPAVRRAMYDFARLRVRDLLTTPWGKTTGNDGVPNIGGRAAQIGDVVTTERGVALLARWHVFRPQDMVSGNASGPVLRAALATAGRPAGDPATWPDSFEQALVAALVAAPPAAIGSLDDVVRWPRWANGFRGYALEPDGFATSPTVVPPGYTPPTDISRAGGLLSATRGSFLLDVRGLPPAPDYSLAVLT